MPIAISARSLAKKYQLYGKPIDRLKELIARGRKSYHQEFWALDDVSFEVEKGQTVGVIGRNGSGKSTLLQIVAGTLQASRGTLDVKGRISALLELGAGFNGEFTGRENVHLAGAIMGISEKEMRSRFDRIAQFAEIGTFMEQPVKTYSSGMYVRLAFATAINVDPEILLVDEALAVGDAVFQYRCIQRIKDLQREGVTIFFVSHDLSAVKSLCTDALLLDKGRLLFHGEPYDAINQYQAIVMSAEEGLRVPPDQDGLAVVGRFRHGNRAAALRWIKLTGPGDLPLEVVGTGDPFTIKVKVSVNQILENAVVGIMVRNRFGHDLYGTNTDLHDLRLPNLLPGHEVEVEFRMTCWLGAGDYTVTAAVHTAEGASCDWVDDALFFKALGGRSFIGQSNLDAIVEARVVTVASVASGERVDGN